MSPTSPFVLVAEPPRKVQPELCVSLVWLVSWLPYGTVSAWMVKLSHMVLAMGDEKSLPCPNPIPLCFLVGLLH